MAFEAHGDNVFTKIADFSREKARISGKLALKQASRTI